MRRILSIVLALIVGLGPALAAVPANALTLGWNANGDESGLPACCRRHGVHHCAMGTQTIGETSISASDCCPCWPHAVASTAAPLAALGSHGQSLRTAIERRSPHQAEVAAGISDRRSWPKRGPPSFHI
jgi:hypothetical protein